MEFIVQKLPNESDILYSCKSIEDYLKSIIYFLIKDDKIVYVGQSSTGYKRIFDHNKKDYDSFFVLEINQEHLNAVESLYIDYFKPCLNTQKGNTYSYKDLLEYKIKSRNE